MIELKSIRLYQPDEKLKQRIGADAGPLSNFVKALQQQAINFWSNVPRNSAQGILVSVGLKPSGKVRVWTEAIGGEIASEQLQALTEELEQCPPPPVSNESASLL